MTGEEQHVCRTPSTNPDSLREAGLVADDDWTCPECGQKWWLAIDRCSSCMRIGEPEWRPFTEPRPSSDDGPPVFQVVRGGIRFRLEGD